MWSLCTKLGVSHEEAVDCVGKVLNRDMGYLFENIEKMDLQEERRRTREAREELEAVKEELEGTKEELEGTKEKLEVALKEIQALKNQLR